MAGEPYNYGAQLANPMQAFTQGLQIGTVLDQQQAARADEQAKRARAQAMAVDFGTLDNDRSPENLARILLKYPEAKDQIAASQSVLSDAEKQDTRNFYGRVLMLRNSGQPERALEAAQARVDALKNTPGKESEAEMASAMLEAFRKNPNDFDTALSTYLAATDMDFYKTISTQSELTSFQKNLTAAGIDPNSEQGRGMAMQFAQRQADPIVEMQTPSGGRFVGPYSLYVEKHGASGAQPSPVSNVTSKAQYDALPAGATYVAPDGSVRTKGGGSGNATGGFR